MGNLRPILIMGLVFLGYLMWIEWQKDYGPAPEPRGVAEQPASQGAESIPDIPDYEQAPSQGVEDLPSATETTVNSGIDNSQDENAGTSSLIRVQTDVLDVAIDPVGGTVVSARLLDYPVEHKNPDVKVELLRPNGANLFIAQSGLLSKQDAPNHTSEYRTASYEYTLSEGDTELRVPLTWISDDGIEVSKSFVFKPGSYEVAVEHRVSNKGSTAWSGNRYDQLQQSIPGDEDDGGFTADLARHIDEDTGEFRAIDQHIIGPLEARLVNANFTQGTQQTNTGHQAQATERFRAGFGSPQHGQVKIGRKRRYP